MYICDLLRRRPARTAILPLAGRVDGGDDDPFVLRPVSRKRRAGGSQLWLHHAGRYFTRFFYGTAREPGEAKSECPTGTRWSCQGCVRRRCVERFLLLRNRKPLHVIEPARVLQRRRLSFAGTVFGCAMVEAIMRASTFWIG